MKLKEYFLKIITSVKTLKLADFLEFPRNIFNWFLGLNRNGKIAAGILVLIIVLIPTLFFGDKKEDKKETIAVRQVEEVLVGEISNIISPLSLVGTVESVSEATIRTESSGQLIRVNKKLGDRVFVGEVIATLENAAQRAAVLQAEGALDQAKAAKQISAISGGNTGNSLENAKQSAVNTFSSVFSTMDDVVRVKTDTMFTNPDRQEARFMVLVPDQILISSIENKRREVEKILNSRVIKNQTINTGSDLESELNILLAELNVLKNYLDDVARALNSSIPDANFNQGQLDGFKAAVGGARAQIAGNISSVLATKSALSGAVTGNQISGASGNPTSLSSDAAIKIAQGSYYAALARLQNTIVRSPITGTLNSLTIKTGDYVTPSQVVAIVSNNGALEVTTYISSDDAKRVTVGQAATLNQNISAVVTRVASAIDPNTRKIEVKLGIKNNDKSLINGQSVKVEISSLKNDTVKKNTVTTNQIIKVYLSSIKITPRGNFVFTINSDNTLKSVPVEIGKIVNEMVEIKSGLSAEDKIVKDARGLKEGQKVEIKGEYVEENLDDTKA